MKRSVFVFLMILISINVLFLNENSVKAEISEGELKQYLVNLNWTNEQLENHLQFHNKNINDFDSFNDLQKFLGTPINNENLNNLLGNHDLEYNDLEMLLGEFGETIDDYQFIEDLELDVEFYLSYQEDFTVVNDFLSIFGLTEEELHNLFTHFSQINDDNMNEKLTSLRQSIYELNGNREDEQLSNNEIQHVFYFWQQLFEAMQLNSIVYLENNESMAEAEFSQLVRANVQGYNMEMLLYNNEGHLLATLNMSEEQLNSYLMYESLEQITDVATIAQQYRGLVQTAKLPTTAGHFITKILLSMFLIVSGFIMLFVARRRVTI